MGVSENLRVIIAPVSLYFSKNFLDYFMKNIKVVIFVLVENLNQEGWARKNYFPQNKCTPYEASR